VCARSSPSFIIWVCADVFLATHWRTPTKRATGGRCAIPPDCDQTIQLTGPKTSRLYPDPLRRIHYFDAQKVLRLICMTNNFLLPALTIADLYRARWRVELFFRWIKQHLHIKSFFGTSENAVKTQVWVAITVYALVAIVKKQAPLGLSLCKILQILSITLFEKTPLSSGFSDVADNLDDADPRAQLKLLNL
jgi:IS4 transposase